MTNDVKFDKAEKRLMRLFAFFAVIILVSQVLQFFNGRNNDSDYHKMLVSRMIIVESSQRIMIETTSIHRSLLNMIIDSDPKQIDAFSDIASSSFLASEHEIEEIEKNIFTKKQKEEIDTMRLNNKAYENACHQLLVLLAIDKEKAVEYKKDVVRPAFEKCQQAQTDLIEILNNDLQQESDRVASASFKSSILILVLGISPFLLFLIYLVFQSSRIFFNEFS